MLKIVARDGSEIIKAGEEGTLKAEDITVCSVFIGKIYRKDVYQCTIMCRRELGTTYDFIKNLDAALKQLDYNTYLKLDPITIQMGSDTITASYYTSKNDPHGVHSNTHDELARNLSKRFNIGEVKLRSLIKPGPADKNNGITCQAHVDKTGQVIVPLNQAHLLNPSGPRTFPVHGLIEPAARKKLHPLASSPTSTALCSRNIISVGMDEASIVYTGQNAILIAENLKVCSVFVGKIYRGIEYECTIMCRKGVGTSESFLRTIDTAMFLFPNKKTLSIIPMTLQTAPNVNVHDYASNMLMQGITIPEPTGEHHYTDDALIEDLFLCFNIQRQRLVQIKECAPTTDSDTGMCKATVTDKGNIYIPSGTPSFQGGGYSPPQGGACGSGPVASGSGLSQGQKRKASDDDD